MIRILKDGSKYCEKWSKICDSVCEQCDEYKNSMFTQNSIIEELEKIKAEIDEIKGLRDNPYNNKTEYSVSMEELRELFDNHIAELKGE